MSKHDIGLAILSTIVIAVLIVGFNLTGSPFEKQKQARDQKKLDDILTINLAIQDYYRQNKTLPAELSQLKVSSLDSDKKKAALSSNLYVYQSIGATTYNLCTTFETNTKVNENNKNGTINYGGSAIYRDVDSETTHPMGYYCIGNVIPSYIASTPVPTLKPVSSFNSNNIIKTSNKAQNSGTSANWLHETTESNTLLVVTAAYRAHINPDANIESVSYNGAKFTKARRDHYTDRTSEIWYLVNPPVINSQITVNFTKDPESQAFSAVTVRSIDTVSPVYTTYGNGSNAQNATKRATDSATLVASSGDLILGVVADYPDGGTNYLVTQGDTRYQWGVSSPDQNIKNNGIIQIVNNSSTVSWTSIKDYSRAYSFIVIKPAQKTSSLY